MTQSKPIVVHVGMEQVGVQVIANAPSTGGGGSAEPQWQLVESNTQLLSGAYAVDALSLVILLLPAIAVLGQTISVYAAGVGGWRIAQRSGQQIRVGDKETTFGAAGNIYSLSQGDFISLTYLADGKWICTEIVGNIQVN